MDSSNIDWSVVAAFFSALAALGSLTIAKFQFEYLKTKEVPDLALSSNFEKIESVYEYDKKQFEKLVNNYYFEIQNLSSLQINLIEVELREIFTKNKKQFFNNIDDNLTLLPLGFPMQPVIKDFQGYHTRKQKINYIKPDEVIKIKLPSFMLKEFIHASYILENEGAFTFKNKFEIKVRYYDKKTSKFSELTKEVPYEMEYHGTIALIYFNIESIVIRLN